jgi:CO/xanthine dehydrogenase FAD-binding subunit
MTFVLAANLDEALEAMAAGARPIAGGSDLVVGARVGKSTIPDSLVAIDRLEELAGIEENEGGVRIGAGVTHARLMANQLIVDRYTALADASALVGSPATRNVGTLGGNIMNASPAMDTGAPLVVLEAMVRLQSKSGERAVEPMKLWTGPGQTSAASDELCVAVELPAPGPRSGSAYVRLEYRRAMEIAVVGAAASVTLGEDGTIADGAVAISAVAPTILEVPGVGEAMRGKSVSEAAAVATAAASDAARPISDLRASDAYRRHMVGVMAGRAVSAAARRAAGESIAVPVNRASGVGVAL